MERIEDVWGERNVRRQNKCIHRLYMEGEKREERTTEFPGHSVSHHAAVTYWARTWEIGFLHIAGQAHTHIHWFTSKPIADFANHIMQFALFLTDRKGTGLISFDSWIIWSSFYLYQDATYKLCLYNLCQV